MLKSIERDTQSFTQQLGLGEHLTLLDRAWEAEIGNLAKLARIVAVERETLVVEVDAAPVMQELSLRRKELLRRINRHFPAPAIKWLNLRTA